MDEVPETSISNKDLNVLKELKKKIKLLPVEKRITAVAIYRKVERYYREVYPFEQEDVSLTKSDTKKSKEITERVHEIVQGEHDLEDDEIQRTIEFLKEEEEFDAEQAKNTQRIANYWPEVFQYGDIYLSAGDIDALKYCTYVNVDEDEDSDGIKATQTLTMRFKNDNPYFNNNELTIKVDFKKDIPVKSVGTQIHWKDGKNLCEKLVKKIQRHKKSKKTRTVERKKKIKSFFRLFENFTEDEDEEYDPEEGYEEQPSIYLVSDTVEQIMDIVPYSIEYYFKVADKDEDFDDEDYDDVEDVDDFDDDDLDDDDGDDRPKKKKKKGKKKRKKSKATRAAETDCKQQ